MITFPPYPIPVITPLGDGYVVYVTNGATWENDCICVALTKDGQWRHFSTGDIKAAKNATYGVATQVPLAEAPRDEFMSVFHAIKNDLQHLRSMLAPQ